MISELARLMGGAQLRCVDVGARGGMPSHWLPFAQLIDLDAIEPDTEACRLQQAAGRPNERWYPVALGGQTGTGKLYVLAQASSSSLYPPNPEDIAQYDFLGLGDVVRIADIPLLSFSDFLDREQRPAPHLIKLDTQGAELSILQGLEERHWQDVVAVQSEVHFKELYLGEPLFHDLDAFMRSRGFMLFDFLPVRKYRTNGVQRHFFLKRDLGIARNRSDLSCRLTGGDVLYLRPPEQILASGDRTAVLRLMAILLIYRCLDESLWLLQEATSKGIVSPEDGRVLLGVIRSRAPKPLPWQRTGAVGKWSRKLLRKLGISRRRKPDYWLDRSWDF
jgi:FkbM family methyltransferase